MNLRQAVCLEVFRLRQPLNRSLIHRRQISRLQLQFYQSQSQLQHCLHRSQHQHSLLLSLLLPLHHPSLVHQNECWIKHRLPQRLSQHLVCSRTRLQAALLQRCPSAKPVPSHLLVLDRPIRSLARAASGIQRPRELQPPHQLSQLQHLPQCTLPLHRHRCSRLLWLLRLQLQSLHQLHQRARPCLVLPPMMTTPVTAIGAMMRTASLMPCSSVLPSRPRRCQHQLLPRLPTLLLSL